MPTLHAALAAQHPDLGELVRRIGSVQVRNLGTIGGNIANGSPIGDTLPAADRARAPRWCCAGVEVVGRCRSRTSSSATVRRCRCERVHGADRLPLCSSRWQLPLYKVSKRFDQDISAVCGAFRLELDGGRVHDVRLASAGWQRPQRAARRCEEALRGPDVGRGGPRWPVPVLEAGLSPSPTCARGRLSEHAAKNLLRKFLARDERTLPGDPDPRRDVAMRRAGTRRQQRRRGPYPAHDSAVLHVTGEAVYVDDIPEPRGSSMLTCGCPSGPTPAVVTLDLRPCRRGARGGGRMTAADLPAATTWSVLQGDPLFARWFGRVLRPVALRGRSRDRGPGARGGAPGPGRVPGPAGRPHHRGGAGAAVVRVDSETMRRGDAAAALARAPNVSGAGLPGRAGSFLPRGSGGDGRASERGMHV